MIWLAVVAVVNMTVALYYYLSIVVQIYFTDPVRQWEVPNGFGYRIALGVCLAGTFFLGILPEFALRLTGFIARLV